MSQCKSCNAEIVWLKTVSGRSIPVNADTCSSEDELFNVHRMTSHFATCNDPGRWRKERKP